MLQEILKKVRSLRSFNTLMARVSDILPVIFFKGILKVISLSLGVRDLVNQHASGNVYRGRARDVRHLSSNAKMRSPADDACNVTKPANGPRGMAIRQVDKLTV